MASAWNRRGRGFSENVYVTERQLGAGTVAGPFSGADIGRALEAQGWMLVDTPEPDEVAVYRDPTSSRRTLVDLDWTRIHEGDPVFRMLAHDMGLSQAELTRLVRGVQN